MIPNPSDNWTQWATEMIRFLQPWIRRMESEKFTQGQTLQLRSVTVAGLPDGEAGQVVYVSDESGGAVPAFHDGTNWRRVTDRAIVS